MWTAKLKTLDHNRTPQQFAALWGSDGIQPILISEGINTVFCFPFHGHRRFLRITHSDLRTAEQLDASIAYNQYLFDQRLPVPEPIVSLEGRYVEEIRQREGSFLAHAVKAAPGDPVLLENASRELLRNWGKTLALFHQESSRYHPYGIFQFISHTDLIDEFAPWAANESHLIQSEFEDVTQQLNSLPRTPQNYGLTHGDHRCGNVLSQDNQVWLIDFDEPVYNWFGADVARPFFELYIDRNPNLPQILSTFIEGYQSVNPSADLTKENILLFLRFKALDIYLWTMNKWDSTVAPGGEPVEPSMKTIRAAIENSGNYVFT